MEDKEIIDLFYARSEQAISSLANKYGRLVRQLANNILHDDLDSEECENDTYLACWNSMPPQYPAVLISYVCRIARNTAISIYRSKAAFKRNSHYDVALDELAECLAAAEDAESHLQTKELGLAINRFLKELKAEDRIIFLRRYWFSDSPCQIAQLLGCTENKVSVRLVRLRNKLRCYLEKEGML